MPTDLTSTPLTGILNPSATSAQFTSPAGSKAVVRIAFATPAATSNTYPSLTAGVVLQRSTDGGSTWSAVATPGSSAQSSSWETTGPENYGGDLSRAFLLNDASSTLYRIVNGTTNVTAVFAGYALTFANGEAYGRIGLNMMLNDQGAAESFHTSLSSAQLLSLMQLRATPLGSSDISGSPLTLYKRCRQSSIAKLSVPSDASRALDTNCINGVSRSVRVSKATVVSLTNFRDGTAVDSDESVMDPHLFPWPGHAERGTIFTAGAAVAANDGASPGNPGSFASGGWGITGFTTLLEAATWSPADMGSYPRPANLTALGL